ncbi:MAG: hypothetical protein ACRBDL_11535 [Alphaproteobacteria bacterium]
MTDEGYALRKEILIALFVALSGVCLVRLFFAISSWMDGGNELLEAYSLCVIFPAVLIFALSFLGKTKTKEGLFMRFGTMLQLFLIISIPVFSLYLALGLPVVFLVVELFVQKAPRVIYLPIERMIIR